MPNEMPNEELLAEEMFKAFHEAGRSTWKRYDGSEAPQHFSQLLDNEKEKWLAASRKATALLR